MIEQKKLIPALVGGLLFALHPSHVEVVANVSNRKDLLAMIFAMAALLVWIRPGRSWPRPSRERR